MFLAEPVCRRASGRVVPLGQSLPYAAVTGRTENPACCDRPSTACSNAGVCSLAIAAGEPDCISMGVAVSMDGNTGRSDCLGLVCLSRGCLILSKTERKRPAPIARHWPLVITMDANPLPFETRFLNCSDMAFVIRLPNF